MLVIPAIDLKDGRCVRLRQGDMEQATMYSQDPAAMAAHWQGLGAPRLHLVDLDGAVEGRPMNLSVIKAILTAISVPAQVGGGIRDIETVRGYLALGVARVVLGTAALLNKDLLEKACAEFPGRIMAGVDARGDKVAVRGWTSLSETSTEELLRALSGYPLGGVIYTDIARDGMLEGPNLSGLRKVVDSAPTAVIASGGISRIEDLLAIEALGPRIEGVIVGKALYEGRLPLPAAIAAVSTGLLPRAERAC